MDDNKVTGWSGWVMFAAWAMIVGAIFNFFYGLAGILHSSWYLYANGTAYVMDTTSWGWYTVAMALLLGLSGALLLVGNWFGRTIGVIVAVLSLLANVALFPVAPIWSGIVIAIDVAVIYAILAHGSEMKALAHQ